MRCSTTPLKPQLPWLALGLSVVTLCPATAQLQKGAKIPSLTVKTLDGKTVNIQSLCRQSNAVLLNFWSKFLPLSAQQLVAVEKLNKKYGAKVQVVGFALDIATKADLHSYLKRLKPSPTFPNCGGAVSKSAAAKLRATVNPLVYVVNAAGVVSEVKQGYGGTFLQEMDTALKRVLAAK